MPIILLKRVEIESQNYFFEINLDRSIKNKFNPFFSTKHRNKDENFFLNFSIGIFLKNFQLNSFGHPRQVLKHAQQRRIKNERTSNISD